jgi:hypothetical protein
VEADRDVGVRIFRPIFLLVSVKSDDLLFWGTFFQQPIKNLKVTSFG